MLRQIITLRNSFLKLPTYSITYKVDGDSKDLFMYSFEPVYLR